MTAIMQLYVFVLAGFVGFLVIARVPPLLHTPLMSAANFISAISVVGAILTAGSHSRLAQVLGFVAVVCATVNVVAGFVVTDRILGMFQRKPGRAEAPAKAGSDGQKAEV
jgi:H+-translocating NAD(P) transhydrogenase subunit alpha